MHTLSAPQVATLLDCMSADRLVKEFRLTLSCLILYRTILFKFRNKKTGECWPSRASMASASGLSLRTVGYCLKLLKKAGWLSWWRRRKRIGRHRYVQDSSVYQIRIPRRWRRVISECKKCPGTTSLVTKVACGQLTRTDKVFDTAVKAVTQVPEGYGHNRYPDDMDPRLKESLNRLEIAIQEKHERELAKNASP